MSDKSRSKLERMPLPNKHRFEISSEQSSGYKEVQNLHQGKIKVSLSRTDASNEYVIEFMARKLKYEVSIWSELVDGKLQQIDDKKTIFYDPKNTTANVFRFTFEREDGDKCIWAVADEVD